MYEVIITPDALRQIDAMPEKIRVRVYGIVARLERWPDVSGVKALAGNRKGQYRIRTGDYRVLFVVDATAGTVTVNNVGDRRDVYED